MFRVGCLCSLLYTSSHTHIPTAYDHSSGASKKNNAKTVHESTNEADRTSGCKMVKVSYPCSAISPGMGYPMAKTSPRNSMYSAFSQHQCIKINDAWLIVTGQHSKCTSTWMVSALQCTRLDKELLNIENGIY